MTQLQIYIQNWTMNHNSPGELDTMTLQCFIPPNELYEAHSKLHMIIGGGNIYLNDGKPRIKSIKRYLL